MTIILSIVAMLCGVIVASVSIYSLDGKYTIVLLLTNGDRKPIPATRFSVPTTNEIAKIEESTRTPASPRGAIVYSWYRVKQ